MILIEIDYSTLHHHAAATLPQPAGQSVWVNPPVSQSVARYSTLGARSLTGGTSDARLKFALAALGGETGGRSSGSNRVWRQNSEPRERHPEAVA